MRALLCSGLVLMALLLAVWVAPATAQGAPAPQQPAAPSDPYLDYLGQQPRADGLQYSCWLCSLFGDLEGIAFGARDGTGGFAVTAYTVLAAAAAGLARVVATGSLLLITAMAMVSPRSAGEYWQKLASFAFGAMIIGVLFTAPGAAALFYYGFMALQQLAIAAGVVVITVAGHLGATDVVAPTLYGGGAIPQDSYMYLWVHVEQVGFRLIRLFADSWAESWLAALSINALSWLFLAVPYVFVVSVFAAYLVQSIFYFVAVAAATPLLLVFALHPAGRGMLKSAFKFLLGAVLTIVFASVAMGFTGAIMNQHIGELEAIVRHGSSSEAINTMIEAEQERICAEWEGQVDSDGLAMSCSGSLLALEMRNRAAALAQKRVTEDPANAMLVRSASMDSGTKLVQTRVFWMTFILGFVSVLLHLAAPRLASNITGSQDTATNAAVTVAAGQFMAAKLMNVAGMGGAAGAGWAGGKAGSLLGRAQGLGQNAGSLLDRFAKRLSGE